MPIINPNELTRLVSGIDKVSNPRIINSKTSLVTTRENNPNWDAGKILSSLNTASILSINSGTDRLAIFDVDGFGFDGPVTL